MIAVLGAGESGVGAALLAKAKGLDVFVSDLGQIKPNYLQELEENGIPYEQGKHSEEIILGAGEIVKSPGIPDTAPIVSKAREKGINVISEIEFASRYTNGTIVGITGSNGKTTTTLLTYEIFRSAGLDVALTGNVGKSLARTLAQRDYEYFVTELSSFQLDGCYDFNPHIAVLLNITPDHLDRYDYKLENYIKSKFRIVRNHTENDYFIYWANDRNIREYLEKHPVRSKQIPFAYKRSDGVAAYVEKGVMYVTVNSKTFVMELKDLSLQGRHNVYNSMAAAAAAMAVDIKDEFIRKTLQTFKGVEHRLEKFLTIRGITFINDSKATNVNSVWYALESMTHPVVLIMGGVDKGNDYSLLYDLVKQKVKAIVALGKDNSKIIKAFERFVPVYDTHSMEEAVRQAYLLADKGDVVLLSPACASFDLFENYIDRGNKFKEAVRNL